MKREFTGVFIPAHIWTSDLLPAEKMLLGEISALSIRSGWCEAGRDHFASWLHCDVTNVTYYIKKLVGLGFLEVHSVKGRPNRMRVIVEAFYIGGSESHSLVVVNPIHGCSESHSPEIQDKYNHKSIITTTPENEFSTVDTNPSTPPIFPAAPPASPQPVGNLAEWLQSVRADSFIRETFTRARKVPANLFDQYFDLFHLEANTKPEEYHRRKDVVEHFLNYAVAKHRIESKPTPQPVNRFNQPDPAPAYKPPKPIGEIPEPKYRSR